MPQGDCPYEESVLPYRVSSNLVVRLIELRNVDPEFSRCSYCGANDYWHVAWPASLALSQHVSVARLSDSWSGSKALVVGAGVGLESVTLSSLGADVTALDHIPESLRLVQRNCAINAVPRVREECACWFDQTDRPAVEGFDVLVGADVLYDSGDAVWVHDLLARRLKPGGYALFADPLREGVDVFLSRIRVPEFEVHVRKQQIQWMGHDETLDLFEILRTG